MVNICFHILCWASLLEDRKCFLLKIKLFAEMFNGNYSMSKPLKYFKKIPTFFFFEMPKINFYLICMNGKVKIRCQIFFHLSINFRIMIQLHSCSSLTPYLFIMIRPIYWAKITQFFSCFWKANICTKISVSPLKYLHM